MAESYSKLTVVKLKEDLKSRGLSTAGLKAQLVLRLEEDDAAKKSELQAADNASQTEAGGEDLPDTDLAAIDAPVADTSTAKEKSPQPDVLPAQEEREGKDEMPVPPNEDAITTLLPEGESTASHRDVQNMDDQEKEQVEVPTRVDATLVGPGANESVSLPVTVQDVHMDGDQVEGVVAVEQIPREQAAVEVDSTKSAAQEGEPQPHSGSESEEKATATRNGTYSSQKLGTPVSERASQQPESVKVTETTRLDTQASVGLEEMVDDSRKRKRRSQSPQLQTQDAALKKFKAQDGSPQARLPEGNETAVTQSDTLMEDPPLASEPAPSPAKAPAADARFKGLFSAQAPAPQPKQPGNEVLEDRDVEPATHPATAALYIRNLQRPLQPAALREHLVALAQLSSSSPLSDPIVEFFVDTIKSHCLAQFTSISSASHVRLALHDNVWPQERDRRPLWIDYIPEDKVKDWIETEQAAATSKPPKRWEVVYEDEEQGVTAYLKEAEALQRRLVAQGVRNSAPTTTIAKPVVPKGDPGRGFKALDDLFMSTTTKPKLYFQPVSESVKIHRLELLAQGRGRGRGDDMRRFSFEDSIIVDRGPEWGFGGRGGDRRGRGGYRGGFEGRGYRGGDSWRSGR